MPKDVLSDAAREERNQYYKEYRARNKEKIRAINKRYWEKRARKGMDDRAEATGEE